MAIVVGQRVCVCACECDVCVCAFVCAVTFVCVRRWHGLLVRSVRLWWLCLEVCVDRSNVREAFQPDRCGHALTLDAIDESQSLRHRAGLACCEGTG